MSSLLGNFGVGIGGSGGSVGMGRYGDAVQLGVSARRGEGARGL